MKNKAVVCLVALGIGLLILLRTCGNDGPSQSLSDIQKPENALSNMPSAASQRAAKKK